MKRRISSLVLLLLINFSVLLLATFIISEQPKWQDCQTDLHCTNEGSCGSDYQYNQGCQLFCGIKIPAGVFYDQIDCGRKV